jgi:tyrosyl-tRNA synthetase
MDTTNKTKDNNYILTRGVAEVIVKEELEKRLVSGQKLRLKEGFDPSSPDIHLGHMVGLRKLRQLQERGHKVVLIVGDWTAQIGDPSGRSATRPMLTIEQVKSNAETYMQQFFKIVDKANTEVRWQSEWFGPFTLADVIRLTSKFTIAQLLARDDFTKRFKDNLPITLTEFIYPLLQAYDSVVIKDDVEFGGTDQKFNLLMGRQLQEMVGQPPQHVFMVPLLIGTDGVHKMSKSLGNYIGVAEPPEQIFGKVMSVPDELLMNYFELLTDVPDKELKEIKAAIESKSVNPMELKKRLAKEIITQLDGKEAASAAEEHFVKVFQKREMPEEIEECPIDFEAFPTLRDVLVAAKLAKSKGEAGRLIEQGGVEIDGVKVTDFAAKVKPGCVIRCGRRRFVRIAEAKPGK